MHRKKKQELLEDKHSLLGKSSTWVFPRRNPEVPFKGFLKVAWAGELTRNLLISFIFSSLER
jgi:hypothetical protein